MRLYFIRHGQSSNNALWDSTGSSQGRSHDPVLSEIGYRQAARLSEFLNKSDPGAGAAGRDLQNATGFGITHLYCSLMVRAVATGTVVSETLGLPLRAWPDLHEVGGIYLDDETSGERAGLPGFNRADFAAMYPGLVLPDSLGESGWWNRPFETRDEALIRAQRFKDGLLEKHGHTSDCVAVISHGDFYNMFLAILLKVPTPPQVWFSMNNVGITRFNFDDEVSISYMNRVDFLPRDLVT